MEHMKYDQEPFGLDIVSIIEEKIQQLAKDYWSEDKCPPEFWVSLSNEDESNQSIMVTISHLNWKFTEKLKNKKNTEYGYNSVINQMISMYNQTM